MQLQVQLHLKKVTMNLKEIQLELVHSNLLNGNQMNQLQLKNLMIIGKKVFQNLRKLFSVQFLITLHV